MIVQTTHDCNTKVSAGGPPPEPPEQPWHQGGCAPAGLYRVLQPLGASAETSLWDPWRHLPCSDWAPSPAPASFQTQDPTNCWCLPTGVPSTARWPQICASHLTHCQDTVPWGTRNRAGTPSQDPTNCWCLPTGVPSIARWPQVCAGHLTHCQDTAPWGTRNGAGDTLPLLSASCSDYRNEWWKFTMAFNLAVAALLAQLNAWHGSQPLAEVPQLNSACCEMG